MFCKGRLAVGAEACGVGTERGLPWSVPAVLHALGRALPPRHFPRLPGTLLLHDYSYLPALSFSPCFLWMGFVSLTRLSDLQAGLRSTNLWVAEISKTEGQTERMYPGNTQTTENLGFSPPACALPFQSDWPWFASPGEIILFYFSFIWPFLK